MPFHTKHRRWGKGLRNEWHGGGAQGLRNDPTSIQNKKSDFFWMPHSTLDLVYSLKWPLDVIQGRWGELHNVFNFFQMMPLPGWLIFWKTLTAANATLPLRPHWLKLFWMPNSFWRPHLPLMPSHPLHQWHTKNSGWRGLGGTGAAELWAPLNCFLHFVNDAASPGWFFKNKNSYSFQMPNTSLATALPLQCHTKHLPDAGEVGCTMQSNDPASSGWLFFQKQEIWLLPDATQPSRPHSLFKNMASGCHPLSSTMKKCKVRWGSCTTSTPSNCCAPLLLLIFCKWCPSQVDCFLKERTLTAANATLPLRPCCLKFFEHQTASGGNHCLRTQLLPSMPSHPIHQWHKKTLDGGDWWSRDCRTFCSS